MRGHIVWSLALGLAILLQTTVFPAVVGEGFTPDFTRGLVIWLAITGTPKGGLYYSFLSGLVVDTFSGAPPGLTAILRVVLFSLARPGRGVFQIPALMIFAGPSAVILDTLLIMVLKPVIFANDVSTTALFSIAWRQALVEMAMVPLIFVILELAIGKRADEATA